MKQNPLPFLQASKTEKLHCGSIGTPCVETCPVRGQVCQVCYAHYGMARMTDVDKVLRRNMAAIERLEEKELVDQAYAMLNGEKFFRWAWSGDIWHRKYARLIVATARKTEGTRHWVSTRNPKVFSGLIIPSNVVIRVSSPLLNQPGNAPGYNSTVLSPKAKRPAYVRECPGECGECRFCWQKSSKVIPGYRFHGSSSCTAIYKKLVKEGRMPE